MARIPLRIGYARDGRSLLLNDAIEPPVPAAYGHQVYYYLQLLFRAGVITKPELVENVRLCVTDAEENWAVEEAGRSGLERTAFSRGGRAGGSLRRRQTVAA